MDAIREISTSLDNDDTKDLSSIADLQAAAFSDEILDNADVDCLIKVFSHCHKENKALILKENRIKLARSDLLKAVLNEIENIDKDVTLQCFRAIGNICIENEEGQRCVMVSGHLDKILNKFKTMVQLSDSELGTLPKVAYGCVNNLSCENESMQLELVKLGAIPIFFSCLKSFIQKDNEMAEIVLEALSGLAVNEAAKEHIINMNVIEESFSLLKHCSDNITIGILDSLGEFIQDDEMSDIICSESCLLALISVGAERPSFNDKNSQDHVLKKIFDSLVLFTSNESFNAQIDDKELLSRLLMLLKCENKHVQTSGALALGNYARNDMICTDLVKNGVHIELINFLRTLHGDEQSLEQKQAAFSALKNIAIPVTNKSVLSHTALPEIAKDTVKNDSAVLQFKALAILRLLVQGQASLAVELCSDDEFLQAVADCSTRETVIGLCAEARRLTAALVKNCQSSDSMDHLLRKHGMRSLIALLSSDHAIMQNEALVSMVTLLACGKDANNEFVQAGGMEESTKLLKQASNKPHLVFNLISLFMAISQDENNKKILQDTITDEIEQMANGPNELVQNRSIELLRILKS